MTIASEKRNAQIAGLNVLAAINTAIEENTNMKVLNDLNDVHTNNPSDGHVLKYDAADELWKEGESEHTIASHNDTTATGIELEELTDGSETTLHSHAHPEIGTVDDHAAISDNDGATDVTGTELEELTDGSETTLHSHAAGGIAYVDRGDPDGYDWIQTDLTIDNTWRDLDLSNIIPAGTSLVLLSCSIWASSVGKHVEFRKKGLSNDYNNDKVYTHVASYWNDHNILVSPDDNSIIQYRANSVSYVNIIVRGWFV